MKKLYLSGKNKNIYSLVDDEDFEYLNKFHWYLINSGYIKRNKVKYIGNYKHKCISYMLSREIMKLGKNKNLEVDHINRNKLDNRKSNLRICKHSQNVHNIGKNSKNTSGYKGVMLLKKYKYKKPWIAKIRVYGKRIFLGYFETAKEASESYIKAEKKYFKEFSYAT